MKAILPLLILSLAAHAAPPREQAIQAITALKSDAIEQERLLQRLVENREAVRKLATEQDARVEAAIRRLLPALRDPAARAILEDLDTRTRAYKQQFLALQQAGEQESRKFQTLSNASKARHDIALNAIRNMK